MTAVIAPSRRRPAHQLIDASRAVRARRRRRKVAADRRTLLLASMALATTGAVAVSELARVWRRGEAPTPEDPLEVLDAAGTAARQTVEVAVAGFRESSDAESALLGVLASFTVALGFVRTATYLIRARGSLGPVRNVVVGNRHIHHFVPGITLGFLAGGAAIVLPRRVTAQWLTIPFGLGLAMTLDESALLLDFDDVYWTEQGIVSLQIAMSALGTISALILVLRLLRRGEQQVLEEATPRSVPASEADADHRPGLRESHA